MAKGIFITLKDLMECEGMNSESAASRLLRTIRDSLGKEPKNKVTITEYARYRGIDPMEVKQELGLIRNLS